MSQNSRNEYLEKMRERYQRRPGKAALSALLDEFCAVTLSAAVNARVSFFARPSKAPT
jgi:hypothetical protein